MHLYFLLSGGYYRQLARDRLVGTRYVTWIGEAARLSGSRNHKYGWKTCILKMSLALHIFYEGSLSFPEDWPRWRKTKLQYLKR